MTGDGLGDIVLVRNGSVTYWPNLGYGRFGQPVQMAGAPVLDSASGLDPKRVRLADIDGTGPSDLIYLAADGVHVHLNQAGNSFLRQPVVEGLPAVEDPVQFFVTDLWGTGTACLVWSSPLPSNQGQTLRWVDLLQSHKPHLLETIDNGLGTTTKIEHRPSTDFYLADRRAQKPCATKLPFPVQVVSRVVVNDAVSEIELVTTYRYHHGFYDGVEREFRGFGMVEQRDAEKPTGPLPDTLNTPPVVTKTWFHTGAYLDGSRVSTVFAGEYWSGAGQSIADSTLPDQITAEEAREAHRALRGRLLRQEIFADDNDPKHSGNPYLVLESSYTIERLQPKTPGNFAVFAVHPRESLQAHYERNAADPRIEHELVLATSPFGDVVDQVNIAYPRLTPVTPAQGHLWATWTHHDYQHLATLPDDYRVGVPVEDTTTELAALASTTLLTPAQVETFLKGATPSGYDPNRRPLHDLPPPADPVLLSRLRHYYWDDALSKRLGLGTVEPRGLAYETLTLALNDACLQLFAGRALAGETTASLLLDPKEAGYVLEDGQFWGSSGVVSYDPARFYLASSLTNPFGGTASVAYDPAHALLPVTATDPAGLVTQFDNDWRLLGPKAVTDANGTRTEVTTDALGIVVGTAIHGASGEGGPTAQLDYAFYAGLGFPTHVHVRTFPNYDPTALLVEESYVYSDGSGRQMMSKVRAEDGPLVEGGPIVSPRWVGSGRTVFNNKALPVKKYEPYFSGKPAYETEAEVVQQGVTSVLHYDPLDLPARVGSHPAMYAAWLSIVAQAMPASAHRRAEPTSATSSSRE